ncbi:MAG: hypothetical protein CL609_21660 [Anaerolineaceae bacterium]|nr:hypothetical protein [Anaerolineaceae bacterium]
MKHKKINNSLFLISLAGFLYNFIGYFYLRSVLVPSLPKPTSQMITLGNFLIFSLFCIGIYHLYILYQILKSLPSSEKIWLQSAYLVILILSGITLLSDVTLLSEIGKEYPFWNVTGQWNMLFVFTIFHLFIVVVGFILIQKKPISSINLFEALKSDQDIWFLTLNQIGAICGLLGFVAFILSLTIQLPDRFRDALLLIFSTLAAIPWIAFITFWFFKNRKKTPSQWLDEKQTQDATIAAFITLIISMPLIMISTFTTGANLIPLSSSYWLALTFFFQLSIFSITVTFRS